MNAPRWLAPALMSGLVLLGCGGGADFNSSALKVGGTVAGLNNSTSVQLTYGDAANTATVAANGSFQFPMALPFNTSYAVTVGTQPTNQTCSVANGSGTARAAVSNITVTCVTNGYTIGGTVSGLTGTVVLSNGAETITVAANGSFTFPTPVTPYSVTVSQQPPAGNYCSVSNGSGTASANVTNVSVSCMAVTNLSCDAGKVLTGINGRLGGIIDRIQVRCADVVSSVVATNTTADGAFAGGDGGDAFAPPFTCPAGEWVSGVSGYNGLGSYTTAMASVQVTCSGGSQSASYNSSGNYPFAYSCPVGKKSTGFIIGAVGGYTGFMQGMLCEP